VWVKQTLTTFSDAKGIIHHKCVPLKQSVNGKFHKEVVKRLIVLLHRVRPLFQKSGFWYLLYDIALALPSGTVSKFFAKQGTPFKKCLLGLCTL
jgi:hypothetical protein